MTTNVEGHAASDGMTFEGMPSTGSDGEAEHNANGFGGQVVRFADLQHERERVFDVPHGTEGLQTEADHANAFNRSLGKSVGLIVYRGMVCISAKRKFPRRYVAWVRDTLNCSRGYAFKCKEIAKNPFLANVSNWKHLPPSVAALYELSSISPERLQVLKEGGELHAKLEISQAKQLAESEKGDVYRPRAKQRTPVQRSRTAAEDSDTDDDMEFSLSVTESENGTLEGRDRYGGSDLGGGPGDRERDLERLAVDGEDLIEQYKIAREGGRRTVEYVRQHGDDIARGLLASGLRELAIALNRDADEIDPPERSRNRNGTNVSSTGTGNGRAQSAPQSPGCDIDTHDPEDEAEEGDDAATVDDAAPPDPAPRARQRTVKSKAKAKAR